MKASGFLKYSSKTMRHILLILSVFLLSAGFTLFNCSQAPAPENAGEIAALSVKAHGLDKADWKTLSITGESQYPDLGEMFRTEYLVYAERPGKVRVEQDLTKYERGRLFYTYFYNNGVGWMQANLKPNYNQRFSNQFKRNLVRCDGIKYYVDNYSLTKLEDASVNGKDAYVLSAEAEDDTTTLYIDKKDFYFVREEFDRTTRTYSEFTKYGDMVIPAQMMDRVIMRGDTLELTTKYNTVEFDNPLEKWLFEEDMPKTAK